MDQKVLKQIILDQQVISATALSSTERDIENELSRYLENDLITIITGMRRVGKSTLLQHIRQRYTQSDFYMDFDDERMINFTLDDFQALVELFIEIYGPQKTFFFDEIQNIAGWERFVRRLHNQGYKVFITGSNATMLSKELGTHLTGRYSSIVLYPFSFREFLKLKSPQLLKIKNMSTIERAQVKRQFNEYIKIGGLPFQLTHNDPDYLSDLYDNIVYRDIIARYKISSEKAIKVLAHYLSSNLGKEVSFNNLKTMIHVASHSTVSEYCHYLENSYLCYILNVYNYSLQKQARHAKKIYFNDTAMATKIGFRHSDDYGRLLENIVFIELKRRHKEVYFHKKEKECDFIIKHKHTITAAYQVTTSLENEKTKTCEYNGLIEAMQTYNLSHGYLLTEDLEGEETIQLNEKQYRIEIIPIWRWLLELAL